MKKTKLKIRLFISALIGMAFLTSCQQNPEEKASVSQAAFKYETPTFNAEDIYFISDKESNVVSNVIFQFETSTSGNLIANQYSNSEFNIGNASFAYKSGNIILNGTKLLSFMIVDDYTYAFSPENALKRESGQSGLFAKFVTDGIVIELSSDGTLTVNGQRGTFENDQGRIYIKDSHTTYTFYYLEEGYLISEKALSLLKTDDKIELHLGMNSKSEGYKQLAGFIQGLPDGLFYKLVGLSDVATDHTIVNDILDKNENKKFAISAGASLFKSGYSSFGISFEGRKNLYEIDFGLPSRRNESMYKYLDKNAFKDCSNLQKVDTTFIKGFGANCFENCTSLEEISINHGYSGAGTIWSMVYIENNAFKGCTALKKVNFSNNFKEWRYTDRYTQSFEKNYSGYEVYAEIPGEKSPENLAKLLTTGDYVDKCWYCKANFYD